MGKRRTSKRRRATEPVEDDPAPAAAGAGAGAGAGSGSGSGEDVEVAISAAAGSAKRQRVSGGMDWDALPAPVAAMRDTLSAAEQRVLEELVDTDQLHLFARWNPDPSVDVAAKHRFFRTVDTAAKAYPGGMSAYVTSARKHLQHSREGTNPFEGCTPEVPTGKDFSSVASEPERNIAETRAVDILKDCAFVLVAGGLGERLGYSGIKVALPSETVTGSCYLKLYIESILALQARSNAKCGTSRACPLAIMTSDDTHTRTANLLFRYDNFGMARDQITLMKQEKVPALMDNEAHIAQPEDDPYTIVTKPHGHGDVHVLLAQTGLAAKWAKEGRKYVVFFQDTNALCFFTLPAAIGVSEELGLEVNTICTTRKAGEAMGAIARLVPSKKARKAGKHAITVNVEYNQLGPLLKATVDPRGDVNDPATGWSPFPGNTNQLIFALAPYAKVLESTGGLVPEFVNPKYADAAKTKFTKPTRLECMMQDHPKLLGPDARVGFTMFAPQEYSPMKNNLKAAVAKQKGGTPPRSASAAEFDFYAATCRRLRSVGVVVGDGTPFTAGGLTLTRPPMVVIDPRVGCTTAALRALFPCPGSVKISNGSTLIVRGAGATIRSLDLDGALELHAEGVTVGVDLGRVDNRGWEFVPLPAEELDAPYTPEETAMRAYKLVKHDTKILNFNRK